MDQIELKVTRRETLGKKVRFLRREGVTPVHLFGHGIESLALQCDTDLLQQVLAEAGKTKLISLKLSGEKKPRMAIVRGVQAELLKPGLLHVDFYQVKTEEAVKVEVPIVLVGEAPALKVKENALLQDFDTLSVECLPAKIPATIELDVSSLAEPNQVLRVNDLELGKDVTVINDPEQVVARISVRRMEKIEEEIIAEEAVPEEEAEAAEAAEAPGAGEAAPPPKEEAPKGE